MVWAGQV